MLKKYLINFLNLLFLFTIGISVYCIIFVNPTDFWFIEIKSPMLLSLIQYIPIEIVEVNIYRLHFFFIIIILLHIFLLVCLKFMGLNSIILMWSIYLVRCFIGVFLALWKGIPVILQMGGITICKMLPLNIKVFYFDVIKRQFTDRYWFFDFSNISFDNIKVQIAECNTQTAVIDFLNTYFNTQVQLLADAHFWGKYYLFLNQNIASLSTLGSIGMTIGFIFVISSFFGPPGSAGAAINTPPIENPIMPDVQLEANPVVEDLIVPEVQSLVDYLIIPQVIGIPTIDSMSLTYMGTTFFSIVHLLQTTIKFIKTYRSPNLMELQIAPNYMVTDGIFELNMIDSLINFVLPVILCRWLYKFFKLNITFLLKVQLYDWLSSFMKALRFWWNSSHFSFFSFINRFCLLWLSRGVSLVFLSLCLATNCESHRVSDFLLEIRRIHGDPFACKVCVETLRFMNTTLFSRLIAKFDRFRILRLRSYITIALIALRNR